MHVSTDSKATWGAWGAYAANKSITLPDGLGVMTVYAQYRDAASNVLELSDAIAAVAPPDLTAPVVTLSGASEGAWYRGAVQVTL
jgi:hypothetical protein